MHPLVNRRNEKLENLFDFILTRTVVRFIMQIEQKFYLEEPTMTTFGWIITLIGIATLSGQFMRLVERVDQPRRRRKTA